MINPKIVGFFALIGGGLTLVGNFIAPLNEKYFLIPIGAGIAVLTGLVALFSRNY